MKKKIAILAGDGIGPEVMSSALKVLDYIAEKFGHEFEYQEALVGGAAYEKHRVHLPDETLRICEASDAILFGSVGGHVSEQNQEKWKNCEANALLGLRKHFNFNANFRPAKVYPALQHICPLKSELTEKGIDLLIIRELVGDIYFGEHKFYQENGLRAALDTATYNEKQIREVVEIAFQTAEKRNKKVVSVDKANVLHTSKLWREVLEEIATNYTDISWEHMLVDNAAMQLVKNPAYFDIVVTSNMFGDILSDVAAILPGSLGLTPSASLNADGFGMYEPSGGSAQDIAGKDLANPIAQILSAAMLLRFSFALSEEAQVIENAVDQTISEGHLTGDLIISGEGLGTRAYTDMLLDTLKRSA